MSRTKKNEGKPCAETGPERRWDPGPPLDPYPEAIVIRMYVRHPVADFARWKQVYDQFDEERKKMGVQGDAVFQAVDDENDVTVWHEFEDEDAAKAFVESDRLRETMEEAGVAGEPTIWYTHRA